MTLDFKKTAGATAFIGATLFAGQAMAFDLAIVAFQMSAETHARCANTAEERATELGWDTQVLNSNGNLQTHAEQIDNLVQRGVDGMILCMTKPVEAEAQLAAANEAGIPMISVVSGTSAQPCSTSRSTSTPSEPKPLCICWA